VWQKLFRLCTWPLFYPPWYGGAVLPAENVLEEIRLAQADGGYQNC
jgi:hypothetical protein